MDKVSIIIPVYNVEKYISRCIESVINQTYSNIEIIIVNDGSPDNSLSICESYAKKDKRIKIITKLNQGLGEARNTGLENVTGKYVLFVDGDDYIETTLVEKVVYYAITYNADFVRFHNYREDIKSGKLYIPHNCLSEGIYYEDDILNKIIKPIIGVLPSQTNLNFVGMSVWRNLYKASIIIDNKLKFVSERIYISEDVIFNLNYFLKSKKAYVCSEPLYHYIVNENSLTAKFNPDRFEKEVIMYKKMIQLCSELNVCEDYFVREQRTFLDRSRMCINNLLSTKKLSIIEKKRLLLVICDNQVLEDILNSYPINKMNIRYRISLLLIKYKRINIILGIHKIFKKI